MSPWGILLLSSILVLAGCQEGPTRRSSSTSSIDDSSFALVQARGHVAMGVDQYTSSHRFEPLADGGRISLVRDSEDAAGVARIRSHINEIALAFQQGDFTIPGFVHDRAVPGTATMTARRSSIHYSAESLPNGAALRISTTDPEALRAIHQFLAFQRQDHRVQHAGSSH